MGFLTQLKHITAAMLVTTFLTGGALIFLGCEREGPAERLGKDIDRATEDAKDALNPPGPAKRAGKKVDRAIDDLKS